MGWKKFFKKLKRSVTKPVSKVFKGVAKGIAKKTPQKPHKPPKNITAMIIITGCKLTASEKSKGTITLPSTA